ncbi:MAG: NnrS family protein [Salinisphaera sp.]|nr:NnrS family protein [Salinisphaera sp.]
MSASPTMAQCEHGLGQGPHWRHFVAAPHRMFFFGGVWGLVLSMLWWGAVLVSAPIAAPAPHWIHGWLLVFGAFAFFVFGFLTTVLPRWLNTPPVSARLYRPAALAQMAGYMLTVIGALWFRPLALAGMFLTGVTWLGVLIVLALLFRRGQTGRSRLHPRWALAVVAVGGAAALAAVRAGLLADPAGLALAPRVGLWAFLAAMVFVVAHRMLPFFASAALGSGYRMVRPQWGPPVVVLLLWSHAALLALGGAGWLCLVDLPLLLVTGWHLFCWQPWKARGNPLLWSLFVAFAWLPVAAGLSAVQSVVLRVCGEVVLGLAPLHALAAGLVASMVFAMVTRVSLGHAGRALSMPRPAVGCFLLLQLAAVARVCVEIHGDSLDHHAILLLSAGLWLCAFTPWALWLSALYWQPRCDGRPG